jgi:hypothetical protein
MPTKTYSARDPRNRSVKCEYVHKTAKSVNCCFTPTLAIEHAKHILAIAQDLLENGINDMGVHVYCIGDESRSVGCGTTPLPKRSKRPPAK